MLASLEIQAKAFSQSTAYSAARLDNDVDSLKSLYESRGYLEAKIIPLVEPMTPAENWESPTSARKGLFRHAFADHQRKRGAIHQELMARIRLAPGKPYSPSLAEQDRQALLAAYNDRGYLWAQVTVRVGSPG